MPEQGHSTDMGDNNKADISGELLRLIADRLPVLIAYIDKDHIYRLNNKTYEQWYKIPRSQITDKHIRDAIGQERYESVRPLIERALSGEIATDIMVRSYPDGKTRHVEVSYVPHVTESGDIPGVAVLVVDVTEREQQRTLLRDVLGAVTEGKLNLVEEESELPEKLEPYGESILLSVTTGISDLRHLARRAGEEADYPEDRVLDLMTAATEAAANAVKHGGGTGVGWVCTDHIKCVQVWVCDEGAGILLEQLPRATLTRGYSTAATMGHGFKIMLDTTDRMWVLTGPTGTTVAFEVDKVAAGPLWLEEDDGEA